MRYTGIDYMRGFTDKVASILGSRRFFYGVIIFFVFEALWVAFSAIYPMAFDEDFHLGVIRIYSQQWSPFLAGQPEGANVFGALAADPSYLYHYLMSFPYRFITLFTDNIMTQVIILRLMNVAMITFGVVLFRRLLLKTGLSMALSNTALLLFALIPAVPLLAGQINYDNLLVLLLAWICLLVFDVTQSFRDRKVDITKLGVLTIALMLTSLVKYAFLPMALAVVAYLLYLAFICFRRSGPVFKQAVTKSYIKISRGVKIALLAALVVSGGLFVQRYGVNIVTYGHPVPSCDAVIGIDACMEYGPWGRNYLYAADKPAFDSNPVAYTWVWIQSLHYRLFFMVNGPPNYINYPPVLLPSAAAVMIAIFGVLALPLYWREVFKNRPFFVFLLCMALVYAGFLWADHYGQYLETGRPVAINGRYLIPLLLPLAALLGRALSIAFRSWPKAKSWAAVLVIVLFIQAGGMFSFILRSDASWYWPNRAVVLVNETAQKVLAPVIFEGPKHY